MPEILKESEAWAAKNPQNAKAQMLLAKALLAGDPKSQRAKELLQRSISLDDRDWESHYELGVLLESEHDYAGAAQELSRATEQNPKEAIAHYHLARVYDRLGEPERAQAEREIHKRLTAATGQ
ncbi:MAG: tetratricopeptide repeat protein [Acidobacteriaceae bacterium]|nr:tetratricopeptide repeat protein [Acidobacteriaceae bacterium]